LIYKNTLVLKLITTTWVIIICVGKEEVKGHLWWVPPKFQICILV
jgi:hypothetical protein